MTGFFVSILGDLELGMSATMPFEFALPPTGRTFEIYPSDLALSPYGRLSKQFRDHCSRCLWAVSEPPSYCTRPHYCSDSHHILLEIPTVCLIRNLFKSYEHLTMNAMYTDNFLLFYIREFVLDSLPAPYMLRPPVTTWMSNQSLLHHEGKRGMTH